MESFIKKIFPSTETYLGFLRSKTGENKMDFGFTFFFNSILLGIGLAMDAFSVSLANGLNEPKMKIGKCAEWQGFSRYFSLPCP